MKILLVGFYGEENLGDEAILKSIKKNIPKPIDYYVTAGKNYSEKNKIIRRGIFSWAQFIKTAIKCDKAIFSGGILQDWTVEGVLFFALRIIAASFFKCEPSLWGAGIGPLRSKSLISITKKALSHVECAWLRDETSLNLYKKLCGKNANLGTDWTWFYKTSFNKSLRNNQLIINIRPWKYDNCSNILLNNINIELLKNVVGVAARNEDKKALSKIYPNISIYQPEDYEKLLLFCSNFYSGIAMRYHVALAMLRTGVETTLIPYDTKVQELQLAKKDMIKFTHDNETRFKIMKRNFQSFLF